MRVSSFCAVARAVTGSVGCRSAALRTRRRARTASSFLGAARPVVKFSGHAQCTLHLYSPHLHFVLFFTGWFFRTFESLQVTRGQPTGLQSTLLEGMRSHSVSKRQTQSQYTSKAKSARSTHQTSQILTMLQKTSSFSNQNYGMSNSMHSSGGCHPPEHFEFEIRAHGMFMRMMMQARLQLQVSLLLKLRAAPKS